MYNIRDWVERFVEEGYSRKNAEARVCQDIILMAIANSSLCRNVTIKGGVVMRSVTGNIRRATQDIDIDFIRYSLEDESIKRFIQRMNCVDGITIQSVGAFEELSQQEYHGKRVDVIIRDLFGNVVKSKIDLGVHKQLQIEQEEYCFDVCIQEDGAGLLINSMEQMLAEKLRSLLKFGFFSTRFKDVFDIMYLKDLVSVSELKKCLAVYIYEDSGMRENDIFDIRNRLRSIFDNKRYIENVKKSDKNWLEIPIEEVVEGICAFFDGKELE